MSTPPLAGPRRNIPPRGAVAAAECTLRDHVVPADRDAVRGMVERTGFFRSDEVDVAVELVDEHLASGIESGYHFVFAELSGEVAGYVCYGPIPCTLSSFDLYWIAVEPNYQRHGIGRLLVAAVEERIAAAGGERIYIDTSGRAEYAPTRGFYERNGFRCEARLQNFYAPGDDRVIYTKALASQNV